jgi:hypothetical protein
MTGLLDEALNVPLLSTDIESLLSHPDGVCVIGYAGGEPIGYIVGQFHGPGRGEKHLFIFQAYTKGHPSWSKVASEFLVDIATQAQCDAISATVPLNVAGLLTRRYKFTAVGVHLTRRLTYGH